MPVGTIMILGNLILTFNKVIVQVERLLVILIFSNGNDFAYIPSVDYNTKVINHSIHTD